MKITLKTFSYTSMACALMFLSSCTWFSSDKKEGGAAKVMESNVLLTIEGNPAVTTDEFEKYYMQILEQQPQLKTFAAYMPDLKLNVFSTLISQKILEHWAQKEKIDQRDDYKADRNAMLENVDRGLAIKYFQQDHPIKVADSEVKKYYEDNKDTIYAMSPAGVNAVGVSFDKEAAAKEFLAKAQQPGADFAKLAADAKLNARQFSRVNAQSQVDPGLRDKILGIKKFPSVQLFAVEKTYWVVQGKSKDEAKYYPYAEAKEDAQNRVTMERTGEMFNNEISKLKDKYGVVEYKAYFETKEPEAEEGKALEMPGKPEKVTKSA